jgi:hypothetical protein
MLNLQPSQLMFYIGADWQLYVKILQQNIHPQIKSYKKPATCSTDFSADQVI